MKNSCIYIISTLATLIIAHNTSAQKANIGISASLGRSFLYTQNFSSKGYKQDYIHAYGNLQYMTSLRLEEYLNKKISISIKPSFIRSKIDYALYEIEIDKFQISRSWQGNQNGFDIYTGLTYDILSMRYSKLRFNLGVSNGISFQKINNTGLQITSQGYSAGGYDITTTSSYSYKKQHWQTAIESGLGWRLEPKLDINLLYSFGLNGSNPLNYIYTTTFNGNTRESRGIIKGRPNYIATELVFWLNK